MTVLESLGHSNTQAERTGLPTVKNQPLRILIDWLGFSITHEEYSIANVLELFEHYLGIEKDVWQAGRKNYEGYQDSVVFENINIYYNGSKEQGIHVDITGQGCRFVEILFEKLRVQAQKPRVQGQKLGVQVGDWVTFIRMLRVHEEVKFTRIDIACDDFHGYFTAEMVYEKLLRGECKSKFKSWRPHGSYDFNGKNKSGLTLYFGSAESRLQCTIYEKDKQLGLDYFWLRTELRFKKQRAEDIANTIIFQCDQEADKTKDIGIIFAGVLKEYITFLEPSETDSNKRRWKTSPFWSNFLAGVEPMRFASCLPDRDIQKIHSWWERQVSKSLAMLSYAFHDNYEQWLKELFELGKTKLKSEDLRIIEDYRRMVRWRNESPPNLLENGIFTQKNESSGQEDSDKK